MDFDADDVRMDDAEDFEEGENEDIEGGVYDDDDMMSLLVWVLLKKTNFFLLKWNDFHWW